MSEHAGEIIIISGPAGSGKTNLGDALTAHYTRPRVRRFEWPRDSHTEIVQAYGHGNVCIVETSMRPTSVPLRAHQIITLQPGSAQ